MNRAHAPAHALLLAACAWVPACGLNQAGVDPPSDTIAYPASAVMDRGHNWLFVTNSNADLRYNDGTLTAFSLTRAAGDRDPANAGQWGDCPQVDYANPRSDKFPFCCRDAVDNNILNCDERGYVGPDDAVGDGSGNLRIGSFAAGMVLQQPTCPVLQPAPTQNDPYALVECDSCNGYAQTNTEDRLLLGVRGDTSLTWIDVGPASVDRPPTFNCTSPPGTSPPVETFPTCDDNHRIIQAPTALAAPMENANPPAIPLPDEPYALAIDDTDGLLFVGHLTGTTARPYSGGFSLFDITPTTGPLPPPRFIAPFSSPFSPNSLGALGITALDYIGRTMYASSRFTSQVAGLGTTATCPVDQGPVREIAAFPNGTTFSSPVAGAAETRGIAFTGPDRAFVLQRSPPALISFIISSMAATDVLETCGSPTFLNMHQNANRPQDPVRLFVSCFADGEIYVFDPELPQLLKTLPVGRGPSGLVFDDDRDVAYVVGFGDNNVSVVDLAPGSRTQYHVVQRIGFPRTAPR